MSKTPLAYLSPFMKVWHEQNMAYDLGKPYQLLSFVKGFEERYI